MPGGGKKEQTRNIVTIFFKLCYQHAFKHTILNAVVCFVLSQTKCLLLLHPKQHDLWSRKGQS